MMPNWYGIEAIKYEWRGPWEGPILHYKGHTFDKTTLKMGYGSCSLKILSLQQKVRANMAILGLILSIFVAVLGAFLLVTAKDDALASISGMVFAIFGSMWAGFYYAMLMGW